MDSRLKTAFAAVIVVAAIVALVWSLRAPPAPGTGRPAEIINPMTRERYKTTWDAVFNGHPKPKKDPFTGGGWTAKIPGADTWGYVVDAGQHHPCEDGPPATQPLDP